MDFLDSKEKKLHTVRLMIGYILMTILIFTATLVLVYQAYGFDVDRKTGEVIQNGLVYVDSAPDKATIYIDGVAQKDRSNTRLVIKEGNYTLTIKRDGYRDWNRKIEVKGGGVERVTYPLLIQNNLAEEEIVNFGVNERLIRTQSPDRRWIMVAKSGSLKDFTELDLKDANKGSAVPSSRQVIFPEAIFAVSDKPHQLEVIEWSNDNEHFLAKHIYGDATEYIILNRSKPETSFNINKLLERDPASVTLRDKKFDQWYLQDKTTGDLTFANAKKELTPLITGVSAYKSHDDNVLLYSQKVPDGQQNVYIKDGRETKLLRSVKAGEVKLEIARFDNKWFVVVASDGEKKTYIYKDPWLVLSKFDDRRPTPQSILHSKDTINTLNFSSNTRFIFMRDSQHFSVYDAEQDKTFSYNFGESIDMDTEVTWMDGHRFLVRSGGVMYVIDFDGSNKQQLIAALPGKSTFFDRDHTVVYSFQNSKVTAGSVALVQTDLRYEQDK